MGVVCVGKVRCGTGFEYRPSTLDMLFLLMVAIGLSAYSSECCIVVISICCQLCGIISVVVWWLGCGVVADDKEGVVV